VSLKIKLHSLTSVKFSPIEFGGSGVAWRDMIVTDQYGEVTRIELFASIGGNEQLVECLRVVGDPPVEVPLIVPVAEPLVEPVSANDYVEGDAC
jgi:hypothetical protein